MQSRISHIAYPPFTHTHTHFICTLFHHLRSHTHTPLETVTHPHCIPELEELLSGSEWSCNESSSPGPSPGNAGAARGAPRASMWPAARLGDPAGKPCPGRAPGGDRVYCIVYGTSVGTTCYPQCTASQVEPTCHIQYYIDEL